MTPRYHSTVMWGFAWVAAIGAAATICSADDVDPAAPSKIASTPGRAIEPAAPPVVPEVVAAFQARQFEDARTRIASLREKAKNPDEATYFAYLQAIAERLAGRRDAARETLRNAIQADPSSRWAPKIRFEMAGIEQASGNWAVTEELARNEATRLLSGDRKDQLAEVYHAFARKLLDPNDPLVPADPNAAYELLNRARDLAEGAALRARLIFEMGRASLTATNPARAIDNFQEFLKESPKAPERFAVRLKLGEAQRGINQLLSARLTWTDLARDIAQLKPAELSKYVVAIQADALYEIASTYGIPNPPDDTSLNLGVSALRRFLAAFPAHEKAVRAYYSLADAYRSRGKSAEALEALNQFLKEDGFKVETDAARRDWAELVMSASFQVAQILQGQQNFDSAIAAWKAYLAKFPNGPQSADAQRAILDTQLLIADDQLGRAHYPEARTAWSAFVAQNPLDGRVPAILFRIGESFLAENKFDQAIAAWEPLISKFGGTEPAAHAQFATALIDETEKSNLADAIERFKKITVEPWASLARQRIAVMESKALLVVTPRTFRSGEDAHLRILTRNIETLSFTAYKLNAESYFRKKGALENVETLDIALVSPDAAWTVPVAGYARYRPVESDYALKECDLPGVYVVKVTDEKTLQATTLVIGSDLDAIVKTSRSQVLVFAQDMKTGRGRPGARVLVTDSGELVLDSVTGPDGVLVRNWDSPREPNRRLTYLVVDGPHIAGSGLGVPDKIAQGLSPRAYIFTDRPAYRPGHKVSIRGVIREVANGQYSNVPKSVYRFEVADARGRLIVVHPVTLSEFGTFHEALALDAAAPVGTYRVRVYQPGGSDFSAGFEVQSYQLEPIDLSFDLKKTVFYRGEIVRADVVARYQYGAPVAGRAIEVNLPDGRVLHGMTDAAGKYALEFLTDGFAEEQSLRLTARLPQDNVAASAMVALAIRGFNINLSTNRDVYLDGESFSLEIASTDAQGSPTGQSLNATAVKQVVSGGRVTERDVHRKPVKTDPKTGKGSLNLRIDDTQGGRYILRVAGTDRFGNPIVADRALTISGKNDGTKMRLLADRLRYKVGEEATVNLHSRDRAGTALLTWEADRILSYKVVKLKEGDNPIAWAIDGPQFPNFTLTSTRMWRNELDRANLDIEVQRDLRVTVAPTKPVVGPGDPVELEVSTVDQLERPVSAELSIAMVDQALLRIFEDKLPAIGPFFYNQTRTGAFATEATNTFRYAPHTTAVPQALVDEAERLAAVAANGARWELGFRFSEPTGSQFADNYAFARILPAPAKSAEPAVVGVQGGGRGASGKHSTFAAPNPNERLFAMRSAPEPAMDDRKATSEAAGAKLGEIQPRERFAETAYWNPSVVTDKDGKARITFKAPSALSSYRITTRGVTGSDTLAGQTTASLTVRKNFFVDLKVPSSLTQGDKPRFIAQVHHTDVLGKVSLRLAVYAGGRDEVYPKTIELTRDGVDEVVFEPFEVPDGDTVRLNLSGAVGDLKDELAVEVPIRPWGVQAFASESGSGSESTTVFVGLPAGRTYEDQEMLIVVSPTLERMIIEQALGNEAGLLRNEPGATALNCIIPSPNTTADRAADLLAATSALGYLRQAKSSAAPEAQRLSQRAQGLVAGLIAAQNPDGGWPWVSGDPLPRSGQSAPAAPPSERLTSAAVVWALTSAEPLGLLADVKVLDQAVTYLNQEFAKLTGVDYETRAALLHALSTRRAASFEAANSLNRSRNELSDPALAYLALTFANLDRASLGGEIIGILRLRAKVEKPAPDRPDRIYWDNSGRSQAIRGAVETTSLVTLAFARVQPDAPEIARAVDWLLAHRIGNGWQPTKAKGQALAALTAYYGRAQAADDRYDLIVTVNETRVAALDVVGSVEGKAIAVPRKALKPGQPNRIHFAMDGRGRFGFAATLTGFTRDFKPDQDPINRVATIQRRVYYPAPPELDGKVLNTGFGVAVNARPFENLASQVEFGGKARVAITGWRNIPGTTPEWERDFLIVEEHLPAGTTLIEGSVNTAATSYNLADGVLTFYFAPNQDPGISSYDVYGYMPGQYRALPSSIRSAYEPGRYHLGPIGELRVRVPGEPNTDPYKPTPDELYARGKIQFDAGRFPEAGQALEPLFGAYTLRDDVAKDAARMLLLINIRADEPRKIVQYFEVVKEKAPELILTFEQLLAIGKAYRDINEYERATIVWRALIEASYLEDARVGELLRRRGKTLEAIAYLIDLWRSYPGTAAIESDFFGLSQVLAQTASQAFSNPKIRRELAAAGVTRSQLLLQSIRMIQVFLSQSSTNPLADEASLAMVGAFTELEDFKSVVALAERFAKLYPRSNYLDSFQYSEALADFHLGQYDRAIEVALRIARASYKDAAGVDQPSPNKWQALYILGQIHDARRQPAKALDYYRQVADRFGDAAGAIQSYTRKVLKVPEVSVVRPVAEGQAAIAAKPSIRLDYRNIARVDIKVYPVDLMQLYLTRRNLNGIAGIDLAGITPLLEKAVALGDGADYADKVRSIDLALTKEGAYLVMIRGENLYASGIVLLTPIELEVLEEPASGRVRVTIQDARTGELLPKVLVKVNGSEEPRFISGESDLRGVFLADGLRGMVTVVARQGAAQYAFNRGAIFVGQPIAPVPPGRDQPGGQAGEAAQPGLNQSLDANLKMQNTANSVRQIERLQQRFAAPADNSKGAAAGGVR